MWYIEHYKKYRCESHQSNYNLVTLEIHITLVRLTYHASGLILNLVWAVHLIICEKVSI